MLVKNGLSFFEARPSLSSRVTPLNEKRYLLAKGLEVYCVFSSFFLCTKEQMCIYLKITFIRMLNLLVEKENLFLML